MAAYNGKFIWYDVMTTDMKASADFYTKVIGWTAQEMGMVPPYTVLSSAQGMVGGVMGTPPEAAAMGAKPEWTGHIGVDDVDEYAKKIVAAGGKVCREPWDIPTVGRLAIVADPGGAVFSIYKPEMEGGEPPKDAPGQIGWRELHAADGESAWKFYSEVFGWTSPSSMDMGPAGVYRMFSTGEAMPVGGMMTKMPEMPAPKWLFYFTVEALDAAVERAKAGGGTLINGPMEVPGGQWIAQFMDPQGAMFAMVSYTR